MVDLIHPNYVETKADPFAPSKAQLDELLAWMRAYMAGPPARKASYEELWNLAKARYPYVFTEQHLLDACLALDKEWAPLRHAAVIEPMGGEAIK